MTFTSFSSVCKDEVVKYLLGGFSLKVLGVYE